MAKYAGKRVLITGGTSGIGLTTARLMVSAGARVLLTGRTEKILDPAREEFGENAIVVESDAASLADIEALAERVKTDFGPIHALFVNAGQTRFAPFEDTTEGAYDDLFAVNAKRPYFTVQKLAPLMREGSGVVFTTSVVNVLGYPMVSAYAATKAAVRSMTRSLARELLPRGIRVNAVRPGPIETSILDKVMPKDALEQTYKQMAESNPMKRVGNAEEAQQRAALGLPCGNQDRWRQGVHPDAPRDPGSAHEPDYLSYSRRRLHLRSGRGGYGRGDADGSLWRLQSSLHRLPHAA